MAFPTSPSNNQVHKEGNRAFVYDSALGTWDQARDTDKLSGQSGGGVFGTVDNMFLAGGTIGSGVTGRGAGIKNASVWHVDTAFSVGTGSNVTMLNWSKNQTRAKGSFGPDMKVDPKIGLWTFPETGHYWVEWCCMLHDNSSTVESRNVEVIIKSTTNGSSMSEICRFMGSFESEGSGATYWDGKANVIFNVTNIATHKLAFHVYSFNGTLHGNTSNGDIHFTRATFIRLGD